MKGWVLSSSMYLAVLLEAARSAAAVALVAVTQMYELLYVSAMVISHANDLPRVHGMTITL